MLVAENGDGAVVSKCGADAVGADAGFSPDGTSPQTEIVEFLVVAGRPANGAPSAGPEYQALTSVKPIKSG